MIKVVVFDLDDTLFPEYDYVKSGYRAVANEIEKKYGIKNAADELLELYNSDGANVFDRYMIAHGLDASESAVGELLDIYRAHKPEISLSEEAKRTLKVLREKGFKLGIITDGRPEGQQNKIDSLNVSGLVDKIILTDTLGGKEYRKPNVKAFELMAEYFGASLDEMLYVGDNPRKDFVVGKYGITTVRLFSGGVYRNCDYAEGIKENKQISSLGELIEVIDSLGEAESDAELLDFVKGKLLCIMDFIHEVCVKENIKYSLSGGTLIGAVRHKGFIPWDDDIDIVMLREEYDRFSSVIKSYCDSSGEFELFLYRRTPRVRFVKDPVLNGNKIGGIKVDIFLIDNMPDKKSERSRFLLKLKVLQGMMHKGKIDWSRFSFKRRVQLFCTKLLGAGRSVESIVKSYFKTSVRYNKQETKDKFISNDLFAVCHIAYKSDWVDEVMLSKFEDREYCIFKNYDSVLSVRYGDYMRLPPIEQQKHHHSFTVIPVNGNEASV